MDPKEYDIAEHIHRFSAWAAATAASPRAREKGSNKRFPVKEGVAWLNSLNLKRFIGNLDDLKTGKDFDTEHKSWCQEIAKLAPQREVKHGVAAKLINVYLKSALINTKDHDHPGVAALHPPIDRVLLTALAKAPNLKCPAFWKGHQSTAWSSLEYSDYQNIIDQVRAEVEPAPLWIIEKHWKGYQVK